MMSASKMSMEIRAKKKAMKDDRSVIDSGGSPSMDLQDEELMDRHAMTKDIGMDHNDPTFEEETDRHDAEAHADPNQEQHMEQRASPEDAGIEEKMLKRKSRVQKMVSSY